MLNLIQFVHTICGFIFDLLYLPVQWMPPFYSLLVFSILTAVLFLWVYPFISNQTKIQAHKNQIAANLLAVRLFQNDLRVFFHIQFRILYYTLRYMGTTVIPILIMLIPLFFILSQLNRYYTLKPFDINEPFLFKVYVDDETLLQDRDAIQLDLPAGIMEDTPAVFVPAENLIVWRLITASEGVFDISIKVKNEIIHKQLNVGKPAKGISYIRTQNGLDFLLYPGEPFIHIQSGLDSIEILYPALDISFFGYSLHWIIWFTILTLIFGFLLKGWMGVQI